MNKIVSDHGCASENRPEQLSPRTSMKGVATIFSKCHLTHEIHLISKYSAHYAISRPCSLKQCCLTHCMIKLMIYGIITRFLGSIF